MTTPPTPPEGDVIRRARQARGLSLADAAARVVELFGGRLSASRLSQIETGNLKKGGEALEVQASPARLAHIAYVVGTSPEQLDRVGKHESAEILAEIIRQRRLLGAHGSAETEDAALDDIMKMEDLPLETREAMVALARAMRAAQGDSRGGGAA